MPRTRSQKKKAGPDASSGAVQGAGCELRAPRILEEKSEDKMEMEIEAEMERESKKAKIDPDSIIDSEYLFEKLKEYQIAVQQRAIQFSVLVYSEFKDQVQSHFGWNPVEYIDKHSQHPEIFPNFRLLIGYFHTFYPPDCTWFLSLRVNRSEQGLELFPGVESWMDERDSFLVWDADTASQFISLYNELLAALKGIWFEYGTEKSGRFRGFMDDFFQTAEEIAKHENLSLLDDKAKILCLQDVYSYKLFEVADQRKAFYDEVVKNISKPRETWYLTVRSKFPLVEDRFCENLLDLSHPIGGNPDPRLFMEFRRRRWELQSDIDFKKVDTAHLATYYRIKLQIAEYIGIIYRGSKGYVEILQMQLPPEGKVKNMSCT